MQIPELTYNDHTLFHLLRHFYWINQSATNCLLNRGYKKKQIDLNLALPGSKFHPDFATDIKSLMNRINLKNSSDRFLQNNYFHYVFEFDEREFINGIGDLGVLDIKSAKKNAINEPYLKMNRGMELWHARVRSKPPTWTLTMVVKEQSSKDFLITAFPGIPAMPIPHPKMGIALLEQCKTFWMEHVFLETKMHDSISADGYVVG